MTATSNTVKGTNVAASSNEEDEREAWNSSWSFMLASVGAAIGLGAIVRFPFLAFRYGGLAFLIPYVIFLLVLGIPLLALEFALGQRMQYGPVGAFAKIHPRMWILGVWACLVSYLVMAGYNVIMAWSWIFLAYTFQPILPWGTTIEEAQVFFATKVMGQEVGSCTANLECGLGSLNWKLVVALAVQYLCVFMAVFKGTKLVSKVVWITVPTPVVMVIILLIYSLTLEGSHLGVEAYIGTVDMSHLGNGQAWVDAAGQIFYGLSLAVGCMIAYGSNQPRERPVNNPTLFVAITNSVFSFIGGFAMFGVMGYLVNDMGTTFEDMSDNVGGFMLSFVSFPTAIALLPSGVSHFFAVFFFLFLLILGIDSAMALTEACTVALRDHIPFFRERPGASAATVCFGAFLLGLTMCTEGGEAVLDITDHFTANYSILLVGLLECVSVWIYEAYGTEEGRKPLSQQSWTEIVFSSRLEREMDAFTGKPMKWLPAVWSFHVKFVAPLIIFALFIIMTIEDTGPTNYGGYPDWAILGFGWMLCVVFPLLIMVAGFFFPMHLTTDKGEDALFGKEVMPRKGSSQLSNDEGEPVIA